MLVTTENGQELAGTFVLQGDNIASHSEEGYTVLMNTVLEEPVLADGNRSSLVMVLSNG
jgi:hypothetical protein